MWVIYSPDDENWDAFFQAQIGGGYYFEGIPYMQSGGGIGTILSTVMRFLLPIAKSVGREVGKEGLALGSRLLGEMAEGRNVQESIKREGRQSLGKLASKATSYLQEGQGRKKKKISQSIVGRRLRTVVPKKRAKVQRHDLFGPY